MPVLEEQMCRRGAGVGGELHADSGRYGRLAMYREVHVDDGLWRRLHGNIVYRRRS
jgi:hypothetical protein